MTKSDISLTAKFSALLSILLLIFFSGHVWVLKSEELGLDAFQNGLIKTYVFNGSITVLIFTALMYLKKKHMASLGFFFLGGSMLKVVLFFIFFKPGYSLDGVTTKLEFAEFFIPYGVCLFFEVYFLTKVLMKE